LSGLAEVQIRRRDDGANTVPPVVTAVPWRNGAVDGLKQQEGIMGKLIYTVIASLDGYTTDATGNFDWAEPDEEVYSFINDTERPVGTYLYGRRMYETMVIWETVQTTADQPITADFADIWRAADKVVYSSTLGTAPSAHTRIERAFDPDAVQGMKAASGHDLSVGGPDLAAQAIKAALVDEYHLFVVPILVGGGTPTFPNDVHLELELLDERRFNGGVMHLHYGAAAT
jgi:dihydrofolate reductase